MNTVHTMPLRVAQSNPYKVGDVISCVHGNGAGEGVLWSVIKVKAMCIWIDPVFCVTGDSVLRRKKVSWHSVTKWETSDLCLARIKLDSVIRGVASTSDLVDLCNSRARLDAVINDVVKQRSDAVTKE